MVSSFNGNNGQTGGSSSEGGGGGLGPAYPDRVSLPFVSVDIPKGSLPISGKRISRRLFPTANWAAEWYAWLTLTQYATADRDTLGLLPAWMSAVTPDDKWQPDSLWPDVNEMPQSPASTAVNDELNDLIKLALNERADALGEILAQNETFEGYFLALLGASTGHPATERVLAIASFLGSFAAMYYKGKYHRPRPSMLCPALLPPVAVPGHASFPSGHSTQSHLMVHCLGDVLSGKFPFANMTDSMLALADRISRNREIAGLHYNSDTVAGIAVAQRVSERLRALLDDDSNRRPEEKSWYGQAIDAARREWT